MKRQGRTIRRAASRLRQAISRLGMFAICASAAAVAGHAQAQARDTGSLRVATFNTYLLSNQFRCLSLHPDVVVTMAECFTKGDILGLTLDPSELDAQADKIADQILSIADQVDVVVLNEVWDERAKDRLVARLSSGFPKHVRKIDAGIALPTPEIMKKIGIDGAAIPFIEGEDSGLMLFAKREVEFLPFAGPGMAMAPGMIQGNIEHVRAQTLETNAVTEDALAAKAVAAVHAQLRIGDRTARAYLLFTHMQAGDRHAAIRTRQLKQIRKFAIEQVIDPKFEQRQELPRLFLLGDINIDGLHGVQPVSLAPKPPKSEWKSSFTSSGLTATAFNDAWAATGSEKDIGPTYLRDSIEGSSRYDYLLRPNIANALKESSYCVQQMRIALEDSPSDHSALLADLNAIFPHCSPRTAMRPKLDMPVDSAPGQADVTRIDTPGAMQWFRFPLDSAATIDVDLNKQPDLRSAMFAADNLSREIKPVETTARTATYSVPKDFFIRIDAKNRIFTGDYTVGFRQRRCISSDQPCILFPTLEQKATFPANNLLGDNDTAWFRFAIADLPDGAKPQQVTISVRGANDNITAELFSADNLSKKIALDQQFKVRNVLKMRFSPKSAGVFLLKIGRGKQKSSAHEIGAAWDTDLTLVKLRALVCTDETDGPLGSESGEDEIAMHTTHDGIARRTPQTKWFDFECNNSDQERAEFAQALKTLGPVSVRIEEIDDVSDSDSSPTETIQPLPQDKLEERSQTIRWQFEDGSYFLRFDRLKGSSGIE